MPSSTFFNLPEEKRRKLLDAALAEFARVPFPEASINKIIRTAAIPRGSFYQYFRDKEELFQYLIGDFGEQLISAAEVLLDQHGGDIFAALAALFDRILTERWDPGRKSVYESILQIVSKNPGLGHSLLTPDRSQEEPIKRLCARMDGNLLDLRGERDMEDMLLILGGITGPAMVKGILAEDPAEVRRAYHNILSILARGMRKQTVPAPQTQL